MAPAPVRANVGIRATKDVVAVAVPTPTAADPGRLLNPLRVHHGNSRRKRAVRDRCGSACGKKSGRTSASEAKHQQKSSHDFSPWKPTFLRKQHVGRKGGSTVNWRSESMKTEFRILLIMGELRCIGPVA